MKDLISQNEQRQSFQTLGNVIFSLNVFSKMDAMALDINPSLFIIDYYIGILQSLFNEETGVQDILITTLAKWT